MNLYPYNSGHLLIAPYEHTGDLAALAPETAAELMHATQRSIKALQAAYQPHAFNVGMNLGLAAGAGVPVHLHVHVVPRWNGDTNFMPVLGETKVLPETLEQTYDRLAPQFRA
jgi:ATP adenylyltransferase